MRDIAAHFAGDCAQAAEDKAGCPCADYSFILAGLSIVLPSLSCVAVTQFRKDGLLPEWLNTMFVQIFVYSYVWAKHTVYLYPVIGSALRLLNVPAQQKPVCKDV